MQFNISETENVLKEYIKENWDRCIRTNTKDEGTLIGLPYPYMVPTPETDLQEMYYWDMFFTIKGLLLTDRADIAKNCTDNMLFLVEKYGFMPNGNRTFYLNKSQPPVLSMMVRDVFEHYKDLTWLQKAYQTLKKEYSFWMNKRMTSCGLNSYKAHNVITPENAEKYYESFCKRRLNYYVDMEDKVLFSYSFLADCESGWDFSPRCYKEQTESVYLDLNCILYMFENNMKDFAELIAPEEVKDWENAALSRKELINELLWNENSFRDYNYIKNKHSSVFSVASFYPLWAKIADEEQAALTRTHLEKIECKYGVAACAPCNYKAQFQWGYPTGWAPLQYIMVKSLESYGYFNDAKRIAEKYITVTEKMFQETSMMWEKYNVLTGDNATTAEYPAREMLGWSAGVYLSLLNSRDK